MKLKARISAPLYNILRDSPISGDMRVLERDKTLTPTPTPTPTATATVRDTWALRTVAFSGTQRMWWYWNIRD
jgi:hypothetical protein